MDRGHAHLRGEGDRGAEACRDAAVVAALASVAAPEAFAELCRDELSGVDVAADGWDIRARWFAVVICATPRPGELGRGITIPWRAIAALIKAQQAPLLAGGLSALPPARARQACRRLPSRRPRCGCRRGAP